MSAKKHYTLKNMGLAHGATCDICDWTGGPYNSLVIAKRMGQCHIVKVHRDVERPGSTKAKRTYTKRKPTCGALLQKAEVNFCPCCGINLKAVQVAVSL